MTEIGIKRMAIQIETIDGQLLHIYSEDLVTMTLERKMEVVMPGYPLGRPTVLDSETILEISGLRSYRITEGRPFGEKELGGKKELEQ